MEKYEPDCENTGETNSLETSAASPTEAVVVSLSDRRAQSEQNQQANSSLQDMLKRMVTDFCAERKSAPRLETLLDDRYLSPDGRVLMPLPEYECIPEAVQAEAVRIVQEAADDGSITPLIHAKTVLIRAQFRYLHPQLLAEYKKRMADENHDELRAFILFASMQDILRCPSFYYATWSLLPESRLDINTCG